MTKGLVLHLNLFYLVADHEPKLKTSSHADRCPTVPKGTHAFLLFCEIVVETRKTELYKHIQMTFLMNELGVLYDNALAITCAKVACCWYLIC